MRWQPPQALDGRLRTLPTGSRNHALALATAAESALLNSRHTGLAADLDDAINLLNAAVKTFPSSTPELDLTKANLATSLVERGKLGHRIDDFNRAIALYEGLDRPDAGGDYPFFRSSVRTNLAHAYQQRYHRSGDPADLERAQAAQRQVAVGGTHAAPTWAAIQFHVAGEIAFDTYHRFGRLQDLDVAVESFQGTVETPGTDPAFRAAAQTNLATSYLERYRSHRSANQKDLVTAIELLRTALDAPPPAEQQSELLGCLARCLGETALANLDRRRNGGPPPELIELLEVTRKALRVTPAAGPDGAAIEPIVDYMQAMDGLLAQTIDSLYDDGLDGLDRTIDAVFDRIVALYEEVNRRATPGSLYALFTAATLADLRLNRAEQTESTADKAAGKAAAWALAAETAAGPPLILAALESWGGLTWRWNDMADAAEAYERATRALHRLVVTQLDRDDKQSWLRQTREVTTRAAYALAKTGRLEEAMVAFESGRAMMLSEALERDQAAIKQLARKDAPLAEEFRQAAAAVAQIDAAQVAVLVPPPQVADGRPAAERRHQQAAAQRYDRAVERIRTVPGLSQFLLPPDAGRLRKNVCALGEPVVLIVTTDRGGVALIVPAHQAERIRPVWLPLLTLEAEQSMVTSYLRAVAVDPSDTQRLAEASQQLEDVTEWLWQAVMGPIIGALGRTRRAVLIPSGLLGSAPLHAAGARDEGATSGWRYASEALTLSYGPNIRALATAQRRIPTSIGALLAVAAPTSSAQPSLRAASAEVKAVCAHFPTARVLRRAAATRATVRAELPRASVQHFACHAVADPASPLESGLVLAAGAKLTLRDIFDLRLAKCRLAVLSACETAVPGADLPNEVISLPTGLLQAGVPGVVASLWEVPDRASAALMARFYQLWRGDGREPPEALRLAQQWLRTTTNGEKLAAFPGASFVRPLVAKAAIPTWSAERSHAHPSIWAAFVYVGR